MTQIAIKTIFILSIFATPSTFGSCRPQENNEAPKYNLSHCFGMTGRKGVTINEDLFPRSCGDLKLFLVEQIYTKFKRKFNRVQKAALLNTINLNNYIPYKPLKGYKSLKKKRKLKNGSKKKVSLKYQTLTESPLQGTIISVERFFCRQPKQKIYCTLVLSTQTFPSVLKYSFSTEFGVDLDNIYWANVTDIRKVTVIK